MGRRSKRKKLILRKLNTGHHVEDKELIRNGLGRIVEENSMQIKKLKEAQKAEAAKLKAADEEAKRIAKLKAETQARKALATKKAAELKDKKPTVAKKMPRKRTPKPTSKKS